MPQRALSKDRSCESGTSPTNTATITVAEEMTNLDALHPSATHSAAAMRMATRSARRAALRAFHALSRGRSARCGRVGLRRSRLLLPKPP